jgi:hypothetical protein
MKKTIVLLFLVVFTSMVFAQGGYLDFRWGMSPDEVQNLLPDDLKDRFKEDSSDFPSVLGTLMFHLYGTEIQNTPDRRTISTPPQGHKTYVAGNWGNWHEGSLRFYFDTNNRLFGVMSIFKDANIVNELQSRYGRSAQYTESLLEMPIHVWENNQRFIISFEDRKPYMGVGGSWRVGFFDSAAVRRMCQSTMEENRRKLREGQQGTRSRLD